LHELTALALDFGPQAGGFGALLGDSGLLIGKLVAQPFGLGVLMAEVAGLAGDLGALAFDLGVPALDLGLL
jgi:hypothetical protein